MIGLRNGDCVCDGCGEKISRADAFHMDKYTCCSIKCLTPFRDAVREKDRLEREKKERNTLRWYRSCEHDTH